MMTHKMSSYISFLRAGSDPTSLCLVWFFGVVVFCLLVCLFWFALCLMGLLTGLYIGPLPALLRLSTDRRPCMIIYNSSFTALNGCDDLAKAMKALEGKKSSATQECRGSNYQLHYEDDSWTLKVQT